MRSLRDLVRIPERRPDDVGFAYLDWTEDEGTPFVRRALVVEGPMSLTAYVGVPIEHPLADQNYDDVPLDVHGGLTHGAPGDQVHRPLGWYWYGWDYAHAGDLTKLSAWYGRDLGEHDWTIREVAAHTIDAMRQLRALMEGQEG